MAAEEREPADPLKLAEALLATPRADFFSLVPLLERLSPNATRVGGDGPPSKEALRFVTTRRWRSRPATSRAARLRRARAIRPIRTRAAWR